MRRRLLLLCCLVVLAGCGGGGGEPSAATTTPDGFSVRTVNEPSFSIALPSGWRSFGDRSSGNAKQVAGKNERLRVELETLARADSPIKLVAVDPSSGRRFLTNMNVLQTQVPSSLTFEQLARTEAAQIKLASGVKNMKQEETQLAAGRALHLTYRARAQAVVHQYFVRHDRFLYVLTYTTPPATASRYAKIFEVSAHTFHVG